MRNAEPAVMESMASYIYHFDAIQDMNFAEKLTNCLDHLVRE